MGRINPYFEVDGKNYEFMRTRALECEYKKIRNANKMSEEDENLFNDYAKLLSDASETTILDCRSELKDTVAITSNIDDNVELKGTGSQVVAVATDPSDATITVTSDKSSVATVSAFADGKFTITGVAKGYAMVTIKASKLGMASWETTMAVEVTE